MRFDARFHRSFIERMRYNVRFSIKQTSFVFMHEAVEVARGGAAAGLRKELLLPSADARRVFGNSVRVGDGTSCNMNCTPRGHGRRAVFTQPLALAHTRGCTCVVAMARPWLGLRHAGPRRLPLVNRQHCSNAANPGISGSQAAYTHAAPESCHRALGASH